MAITLYSRPRGPICYESDLLGNEEALRRLPTELLSTRLSWYWASARSKTLEENTEFIEPPQERQLTGLTKETATALVEDFRERDVDGYGRSIVLLGADSDGTLTAIKREHLERALKDFSESEEGPIRMLVVQVGDSPEYIFVTHDPVQAVLQLLECWRIVPSNITAERPYERLNLVRLESVLHEILNLACGTD